MRDDLLALTPDALAALANRGLVKRATKDLDAGTGPTIEVEGATVRPRGGGVLVRRAGGVPASDRGGARLPAPGCG
jgi:hypothetical protein